ncbi:MAG: 4-hydroxythreonine-4-phosphate dehydrogenase PdxA [Alphaproteobacteria bacterium]
MTQSTPLALTMGEPAGIGGEITLKAWLERNRCRVPAFFAIDDPDRLGRLASRLGADVPIETIAEPGAAITVFPRALPVLAHPLARPVTPGQPDAANTKTVIAAIDRAVELVQTHSAAAMVTNPIHKETLYEAGFSHPGHTEYLGDLTNAMMAPVMMLACPGLRVVPVTIHMPLRQAIASLSTEAIIDCAVTTEAALRTDFGIKKPQLAVAAINPHGGEGGALGLEEREIITPAVDSLKRRGITVYGPVPADSLFHQSARDSYDAVICMHHDQALIPLKTIDFYGGANITLGLPLVRTSPDHGTALDIAGTGTAREDSLIAALKMAASIAEHRAAANAQQSVA